MPPKVVALAHVCHLWREVALSTPTLWNDIQSSCNPRTLETFLRLSGSAPLYLSLRHQPSSAVMQTLLSESERLQDLYWEDISLKTMNSVLALPAPNLEILIIGSDDLPLHREKQPLVLFGAEGAPRLRALTLHGIFRIPAQHFPLLTHLHLFETSNLAALKDIVHLLRNCPLLAEFGLDSWCNIVEQRIQNRWATKLNSSSSSPPKSFVPLDRLKTLYCPCAAYLKPPRTGSSPA